MLRKYLRRPILRTVKMAFSAVGVRFTRKAVEKSVPFGFGVAAGVGINYGITYYVGNQTVAWLRLDSESAH